MFIKDFNELLKKNNIVKITEGKINYEFNKYLYINSLEIQVSSDGINKK